MALDDAFCDDFVAKGSFAVKRASHKLLALYGDTNVEQEQKDTASGKSIFTPVDKLGDEELREEFHGLFPDFDVLSEENREKIIGKGEYCIQIDSLDGTRDFLHKTDQFVISCSLVDCRSQSPVIGIIYKPLGFDKEKNMRRTELYTAIRNKGAFLEIKYLSGRETSKRQIHVSEQNELPKSTILVSMYHPNERLNEMLLKKVHVGSITRVGSGGNKLCMIANSLADGYIHFGAERLLCEWDTSAGHLMVEEAGGVVTDIRGRPLRYTCEWNHELEYGIVAGNRAIHAELVKRLLEELTHKA